MVIFLLNCTNDIRKLLFKVGLYRLLVALPVGLDSLFVQEYVDSLLVFELEGLNSFLVKICKYVVQ